MVIVFLASVNKIITFHSHSNEHSFEDFNMMLYPNKTTALVGTSGNGKSTIAALLARLYDPQS